ncbi:hypothetical protein HQQ94_00675 [Shewanella sp. VB17]|uniref:hypothetical protein n=1 Tax=Shewanella sp. VB17 TaxID=2739432 RepID=UPI0015659ECA|nr:hypothetical protein [Shewanella sp. VB17]NRD71790.1 hypothetical protein [Shewanella sp. VB17]
MSFKKNAIFIGMLLVHQGTLASPWTDHYQVAEPQYLPSHYQGVTDSTVAGQVVKQDMLLNASDLKETFSQYPSAKTYVFIADTLVIDESVIENIAGKNIFVLARVITGTSSLAFIQRDSHPITTVTVVADEIEPAKILITSPSGHSTWVEDRSSGYQFKYMNILGNERVTYDESTIAGIIALLGNNKDYIFNNAYDLSASIFDSQSVLTLEMLDWYATLLGHSSTLINEENEENFGDIFRALKSLNLFYSSSQKAQNYVPVLNLDVYSNNYGQILDAMEAYQSEYDQFENHQIDIEARQASAALMLEKLDNALNAQEGIVNTQISKIERIQASLTRKLNAFELQEVAIIAARDKFRAGIISYQTRFGFSLVLDVFSALSELATSVISAFTIGPAALAGAAEAIGEAADSAQQGVNIAKKLTNIGDNITKINKLMGNITRLLELIKTNKITAELNQILQDSDLSIPSIESATLEWDLAKIDIDTTLGAAEKLEILGTREYKNELSKLITTGSSASSTQLTIILETYRLAELQLAKQAIEDDYMQVSQYIEELGSDEQALEKVERYLYRAYNFFKRPLYSAQLNYNAAYKYHTFHDSTVVPSANASYLEYNQNLVSMNEQLTQVVETFYGNPPQTFWTSTELTDETMLNRLKETGEFTFIIDEQNHNSFGAGIFNNKERVRLERIGVRLLGEELEGGRYEFQLTHTGEFRDFYQDQAYLFNTKESDRTYSYEKEGQEYTEITSGEVAEDFGAFYFKPTPFSTWTVKLFEHEKFDLTKVQSIELIFEGDWVTPPF